MLNNLNFLHNSSSNIKFSFNKTSEDYVNAEPGDPNFMIVWESAVIPLSDMQRITFFVLTVIVSIIAIIGNSLVLYVNFIRLNFNSKNNRSI